MSVVWPEYINLNNWGAALVADYPNAYLPLLHDENKWQEWGAAVVGTGIFARSGVPSPFSIAQGVRKENFKNWQEWAKVVYLIVNNESNIEGGQNV
jgi:hypothetical protein